MKVPSRIESVSNPRIIDLERRIRRGETMLVEGEKLISEAFRAGSRLDSILVTAEAIDTEVVYEATREGSKILEVSSRVLERLTDLPSSRGVAAVAPVPEDASARGVTEINRADPGA